MRFLTRWLSHTSRRNNQAKSLENGSDAECLGGEPAASRIDSAGSATVRESPSVAEAVLPFSVSELQRSPVDWLASPEQTPAKTQAMIDAELTNSDAWLNDIEKGKAEWVNQHSLLQEKLSFLQQNGGEIFLMPLSSYFDLAPDSILEESFRVQLQQRIERLFDLNDFKKIIEEKTRTRRNSYPRSVDYYVGEFVIYRWFYVQGVNRFIDLVDKNIEVVQSHIEELSQAEQEHCPHAGGTKLSLWRGFTRRFSQQHLVGVQPVDFFPEPAPRYLREYLAEEMGVGGARFLWALIATVKFLSRPGGRSTSEIGIEFEKKLIEEISGVYPNAQIETTPKTGDQGADVLILIEGVKIVIQAKKYTGVVGNTAVQEVFAAKEYYEADYAMVVTSSRYTQSASTLAGKIGVELATEQDYLRRIQQLLV
ncbi:MULTISPECIES: restriction endonuclease [Azospira]|uniref:restriction endonuclease n=1 Tax=Azospira TaxID=146937 RepID=UPI0019665090|nr:restriction endonuclease [Azospira oryzae]